MRRRGSTASTCRLPECQFGVVNPPTAAASLCMGGSCIPGVLCGTVCVHSCGCFNSCEKVPSLGRRNIMRRWYGAWRRQHKSIRLCNKASIYNTVFATSSSSPHATRVQHELAAAPADAHFHAYAPHLCPRFSAPRRPPGPSARWLPACQPGYQLSYIVSMRLAQRIQSWQEETPHAGDEAGRAISAGRASCEADGSK